MNLNYFFGFYLEIWREIKQKNDIAREKEKLLKIIFSNYIMSGGSRRPRYRQVLQNPSHNNRWGKTGFMSCQFRSKRNMCNAVKRRINKKKEAEPYKGHLNALLYTNSTDRTEGIRKLVDDWLAGGARRAKVVNDYGEIGNWDTSNVTDMSHLFGQGVSGANTFNEDISNWDTSKVTNMTEMFYGAPTFNQNISTWDTASIDTSKMTQTEHSIGHLMFQSTHTTMHAPDDNHQNAAKHPPGVTPIPNMVYAPGANDSATSQIGMDSGSGIRWAVLNTARSSTLR